ncbi:MAG TPA: CHAT domain-containing protein, partial [Anaerolineae bacterium]|nr:CHAT domain-containing protein [Anaerolineae bacterium]
MTPMNSLEIEIKSGQNGRYPVTISYRPVGDFEVARGGELVWEGVERELRQVGDDRQAYGEVLGRALFQDVIRDTWMQARRDSEGGVRVLLNVEAPELKGFQWERLCAPSGGSGAWRHLHTDQRAVFSWYLPSANERRFPPIGRMDLGALVVLANPPADNQAGLARVDGEATIAAARRGLGEIPTTVLAHVEGADGVPTVDNVLRHLSEGRYTILHLIAHGYHNEEKGKSYIYFVDETGERVEPVTATTIIERFDNLAGGKLPYFIFLCTCDSAKGEGEGALGGIGQRLVRELGVPAVVAMTEQISVATAEVLTTPFYEQLRAHGEVDRALVAGLAGVMGAGDVLVPAVFGRLGERPLFSDSLERPLTDKEIVAGLARMKTLVPERAPILWTDFVGAVQKVQPTLGVGTGG